MSLSSDEISLVVDEVQAFVGGTVQKLWVPTPRVAIFELRIPGATHHLLISAEPNETRIHRATGRPASPANPLAFQGLLRAHLLPARILSIAAATGERVVRVVFHTPGGDRVLVGELMGRHGNLVLLDGDDSILGLAVPSRSQLRSLRRGLRYEPPLPPPPQLEERGERPSRFSPMEGGGFPISEAIEAIYRPIELERESREVRREITRLLSNAQKRAENALEKLRREASRARSADELRLQGELLKPLLGRIPRGATSVRATDHRETGPVEIEIPLRPDLSPRENLERIFKSYQRMRKATSRIEGRMAELEGDLLRISELRERAEGARSPGELEELLQVVRSFGSRPTSGAKRPKEERRSAHRSFQSSSGRLIWVGRGASSNDELTFRIAKGSDLWLHARGVPGAHVVVPLERGAEVDRETLLDAAALAAHFSGATGEAVAEVSYTHVKHVHKPKGSRPGAAALAKEKTLAYRAEKDRLRRLLASERR